MDTLTLEEAEHVLELVSSMARRTTWARDIEWGLYHSRNGYMIKAISNAGYNTIRLWFKRADTLINSYTSDGDQHWIEFYRPTYKAYGQEAAHDAPAP